VSFLTVSAVFRRRLDCVAVNFVKTHYKSSLNFVRRTEQKTTNESKNRFILFFSGF